MMLQIRGDGRTVVCCIHSVEMIMTLTLNTFTKPQFKHIFCMCQGLLLERASKLEKNRTIFNVKPLLPSKKMLLHSYKVFIRREVL